MIGNLKGGWQPYASIRMVWNTIDKTRYTAEDIALPQMTVAPYFQYGLGLQKRWGERFTGFLQAMARSGGRNGVALSAGFRWTIGKSSNDNPQNIKEIKPISSGKVSVQEQNVVKTSKGKSEAAKVENKQSQKAQNTNKKSFFRRLLDAMNKSSSVNVAQDSNKKVIKSLSDYEKNHLYNTTRTKIQAYVDKL